MAITRKNLLFSDSPKGTEASAIIFRIVNTVASNNLDANKHLKHIFRDLTNNGLELDTYVLNEYLPWAVRVQLECRVNTKKKSSSETT